VQGIALAVMAVGGRKLFPFLAQVRFLPPHAKGEVMPAYQFVCPKCEKNEERIFSMSEKHNALCEDCKCLMNKVFSAPDIILKGFGWGKN